MKHKVMEFEYTMCNAYTQTHTHGCADVIPLWQNSNAYLKRDRCGMCDFSVEIYAAHKQFSIAVDTEIAALRRLSRIYFDGKKTTLPFTF